MDRSLQAASVLRAEAGTPGPSRTLCGMDISRLLQSEGASVEDWHSVASSLGVHLISSLDKAVTQGKVIPEDLQQQWTDMLTGRDSFMCMFGRALEEEGVRVGGMASMQPSLGAVLLRWTATQTALLEAAIDAAALHLTPEDEASGAAACFVSSLSCQPVLLAPSAFVAALQLHLPVFPRGVQVRLLAALPQLLSSVDVADVAGELLCGHLAAAPETAPAVLDAAEALCLPTDAVAALVKEAVGMLPFAEGASTPALASFVLRNAGALLAEEAAEPRSKRSRSASSPSSAVHDASAARSSMNTEEVLHAVFQCIEQCCSGGLQGDVSPGLALLLAACRRAMVSNLPQLPVWAERWVSELEGEDADLHLHGPRFLAASSLNWCCAHVLTAAGFGRASDTAVSQLLSAVANSKLTQDDLVQLFESLFTVFDTTCDDAVVWTAEALSRAALRAPQGKGKAGAKAVARQQCVVLAALTALLKACMGPESGVEQLNEAVFAILRLAVKGNGAAAALALQPVLHVLQLTGQPLQSLGRFWEYFVSVMDHMSAVEPDFVHALYACLLLLRVGADGTPHHELDVMINKQLQSKDPKYLACGVMGTLCKLRWLGWWAAQQGPEPGGVRIASLDAAAGAGAPDCSPKGVQDCLSQALSLLGPRHDAKALLLVMLASAAAGPGTQSHGGPVAAPGHATSAFVQWSQQRLQGLQGVPAASQDCVPAFPNLALQAVLDAISELLESDCLQPALPAPHLGGAFAPPVSFSQCNGDPQRLILCELNHDMPDWSPLALDSHALAKGQCSTVHAALLWPALQAAMACAQALEGAALEGMEDFLSAGVVLPEHVGDFVTAWQGAELGQSAAAAASTWPEWAQRTVHQQAEDVARVFVAMNWFRSVMNTWAVTGTQCARFTSRFASLHLALRALEQWLARALHLMPSDSHAQQAVQHLALAQPLIQKCASGFHSGAASFLQPQIVPAPWLMDGEEELGAPPGKKSTLGASWSAALVPLMPHVSAVWAAAPAAAWPASSLRAGLSPRCVACPKRLHPSVSASFYHRITSAPMPRKGAEQLFELLLGPAPGHSGGSMAVLGAIDAVHEACHAMDGGIGDVAIASSTLCEAVRLLAWVVQHMDAVHACWEDASASVAKALLDAPREGPSPPAPASVSWPADGRRAVRVVATWLLSQVPLLPVPKAALATLGAVQTMADAVQGDGEVFEALQREIELTCQRLLEQPQSEETPWRPSDVAGVVKRYMRATATPFKTAATIGKGTLLPLLNQEPHAAALQLVGEHDVASVWKALFQRLVAALCQETVPGSEASAPEQDAFLALLEQGTAAAKLLMVLTKQPIKGAAPLHAVAVRQGATLFAHAREWAGFLTTMMPVATKRVVATLKNMQSVGRQLHAIAGHAQAAGARRLATAITSLRSKQEGWLFAVKSLLTAAGAGQVFWMGSLKAKDLTGQEVGSQLAAAVPASDSAADSDGDGEVDEEGE